MMQKELSQLTDQELLQEAKKARSATIVNAVLIGFLIGIVLYSIFKNRSGLVTLFPLFLAYKAANNSKHNKKEVDELLRERNLK